MHLPAQNVALQILPATKRVLGWAKLWSGACCLAGLACSAGSSVQEKSRSLVCSAAMHGKRVSSNTENYLKGTEMCVLVLLTEAEHKFSKLTRS